MSYGPPDPTAKSFVGGQPSFLPETLPWPKEDDELIGFVMQIEVDGERLGIPDASSIQLYQPIDDGDDPTPMVAVLSLYPRLNDGKTVVTHPLAKERSITFIPEDDPDKGPDLRVFSPEALHLFFDKLGGTDPWNDDREFLGQIREGPLGLNFGGLTCCLYRTVHGEVVADLH